MIKYLLVFLIFLGIYERVNAQEEFPLDTVINYGVKKVGECVSINIFNDKEIKTLKSNHRSKKGSNILINNIPIDSSNRIIYNPFLIDNEIVFESHAFEKGVNAYKVLIYNLIQENFKDLDYFFEGSSYFKDKYLIDQSYRFIYSRTNDNDVRIYKYNYKEKEEEEFIDLTKYAYWFKNNSGEKVEISSRIRDCFFIDKYSCIIFLENQEESGGYAQQKYFYVNNGVIEDITEKINSLSNISTIQMVSEKLELKTLENINGGIVRFYIRNANYNLQTEVLLLGRYDRYYVDGKLSYSNLERVGVNLQNEIIENYFYKSQVFDGRTVIVPYKFIPGLDIAMYKAYNDTLLKKEELEKFGKYELGILRNLIFAKHNYAFNSEFYQAYFNLFAFYNHPDMRKNRTKNVNDLLTDVDKKNLELITGLENK